VKKKTQEPRKKIRPLPIELRDYYNRFLDWHYFGFKFQFCQINEKEQKVEEVEEIRPVNYACTLDFWSKKNDMTFKEKTQWVKDYWKSGAYKDDDPCDRISFKNRLSQTSITEFHEGGQPVYGCSRGDAKVHNLMLDFDDKARVYGDTLQACEYVNTTYLLGETFVQPSTSGSGAHGHFLLEAFADPYEQKKVLSEFISLLKLDLKAKKFKCWEDLDAVKFQASIYEWVKSEYKAHEKKPWYPKLAVCGVLGRLPNVAKPEDLQRLMGRQIINEVQLRRAVASLNASTGAKPQQLPEKRGRRREPKDTCVGQTTQTLSKSHSSPEVANMNGAQRRCHCVDTLLRQTSGGSLTVDQVLEFYHAHYSFTGNGPADVAKRCRDFKRLIPRRSATFVPSVKSNPFSIKSAKYVDVVNALSIPATEFQWPRVEGKKARRELLTPERLAAYLSMKVFQCMTERPDKYFGRATRNSVISLSRTLATQEPPVIDFVLTANVIQKYNDIAVHHGLLTLVDDYQAPRMKTSGMKLELEKGWGKLLAPTKKLDADAFLEFTKRYDAYRSRLKLVEKKNTA